MKSFSGILFLCLLLLLPHFIAADSPVTHHLDQHNQPPASPDRIKPSPNTRKQHLRDPNQNFDYNYLSEFIFCYVNGDSPLSGDVSGAIDSLNLNEPYSFRCSYNTLGDGKNQFCTTLTICKSAGIAICTTLIKKVDCRKIAGIVAVLKSKCEEEHGGEFRVGGRVRMTWGNIHVFNSTLQLRAGV